MSQTPDILDKIFAGPGGVASVYEVVNTLQDKRAMARQEGITRNRQKLEDWIRREMRPDTLEFKRFFADLVVLIPSLGDFTGWSGDRLYREMHDRLVAKLADMFEDK